VNRLERELLKFASVDLVSQNSFILKRHTSHLAEKAARNLSSESGEQSFNQAFTCSAGTCFMRLPSSLAMPKNAEVARQWSDGCQKRLLGACASERPERPPPAARAASFHQLPR
jgi:hypothetical protein